jgi:DNA-directed RNA polymerase specialized sigma24 family protein
MLTSPERRQQVGAFFAAHADRLRRTVAWHARTVHDVIDDACASAWTILVRRPDITLDARGFSWLATVAIHEARHLSARHRQELLVGTFQADPRGHDDQGHPEPADPLALDTETQALDHIQDASDVEAFQTPRPRERQALYLKALGYSYDEIGRLTGITYTAVNGYITEAGVPCAAAATRPSSRPRRRGQRWR